MAEEVEDNGAALFEVMTAEEVKSMYHNGSLINPDYKLYRLNCPSGRVYFIFNDAVNMLEPVCFGGTGMVGKELPTSDLLIADISNKGYGNAKRNYYCRMLFGSFSHSRLADFAILGKVHLDELPDMLQQYYYDQHFYITDKEFKDMSVEIQKDMISIRQWMMDFEAELVFVEFPVYSHALQMASQIDLAAFITIKEGSGKNMTTRRAFALCDYKSGKSGFYTEHKYQLYSNLQMFTERYPEFTEHNIELYNLSGKNWRKTNWDRRSMPYSFTNQSNAADLIDYKARLDAAKNHLDKRLQKTYTYIQGEMKLTDNPKDFIVQKTIADLIAQGDWKRFVKTSASIPQNQ